jgi:dTDP-4-dehydrorhamnose 3,5-epimerase
MRGGIMPVNITSSQRIDGLLTITGKRHYDNRGAFEEAFSYPLMGDLFPHGILQISHSFNRFGVLRGMHLQTYPAMAKSMRVVRGAAAIIHLDADVRSRTYGNVTKHILSDVDSISLYAPALVARGFLSLREDTIIEYLHSETFNPSSTYTLKWDDPIIGDIWNHLGYRFIDGYIMSDNDRHKGISFSEWSNKSLDLT